VAGPVGPERGGGIPVGNPQPALLRRGSRPDVASIPAGEDEFTRRGRDQQPPPNEKEAVTVISTTPTAYTHDCDHGFCVICGSVWPCSRAQRATPTPVPLPRTEYFDY